MGWRRERGKQTGGNRLPIILRRLMYDDSDSLVVGGRSVSFSTLAMVIGRPRGVVAFFQLSSSPHTLLKSAQLSTNIRRASLRHDVASCRTTPCDITPRRTISHVVVERRATRTRFMQSTIKHPHHAAPQNVFTALLPSCRTLPRERTTAQLRVPLRHPKQRGFFF